MELFLILGVSILTIFIQFRTAKKVEKLKTDLRKSEIKFNKHTEMQIECLKNMYSNVVDIYFAFSDLVHPKYFSLSMLKEKIKTLPRLFAENRDYFHRNRILLTDEISDQIRVVYEKLNAIEDICNAELEKIWEMELHIIEYPNSPEEPQAEVNFAKQRIKYLQTLEPIQTFEADIKKLRELVENYFKELTENEK